MRPSLDTAATSTYPSLTSEASSIVSSEQPQTVSENHRAHSPSHWRLGFSGTTTTEKDRNETPLTPRFARRLLRLVGSSHHQSTLTPTNAEELASYAARGSQPIPRPHSRQKDRSREEAAASWSVGRASLASASTTPLASKHSSLGPLPIFPRAPVRTLSRHSSLSSTLSQARARRDTEDEDDHQSTVKIGNFRSRIEPAVVNPATTPPPSRPSSRTAKLRPTLASLFQSAGRKAMHKDEFRKDSYSKKDNPPDDGTFVQSVPSTPFRRRFLGLMPDSIRSARSATPSPAPPLLPALSTPPVPVPIPVSSKGKENATPPWPIIKRKRSSLPNPPRAPYDQFHDHTHNHNHDQTDHETMNGHSLSYNESTFDANNPYAVRRSRSDSKGKKAASQSHATSVRVPAGPMQHHPHPHPYFPCETPLDRGILSHGSFDFERPGTRPTTPRQSQEYLPIERTRRSRGRMEELDSGINSGMDPEIKRVLAAGTGARRERRAPSRERLRVIGPMQRSNLPDVTGGDNQFSPDPDNGSLMPPVPPVPGTPSARPRTHMSHGMFAFESPAATPYGSRIELPPAPPLSKPRRDTLPHAAPPKGHHRQMSSSATAVSSPPIPIISAKKDPYYETDDSSKRAGKEMGFLRAFSSPKPSSIHSKPIPEKRVASPMGPPVEHYRRGSGSTMSQESGVPMSIPVTYKLDLNTGRPRGPSPSSFRHNHFHSQSLSGSTAQSHYAPGQSPSTVGSVLYPDLSPPSREDRYHDLCQALRLSMGDSRYKSFERAVRRYKDRLIPLDGDRGVLVRVQQLLDGAVADGQVPALTARKYLQTFHTILVDE